MGRLNSGQRTWAAAGWTRSRSSAFTRPFPSGSNREANKRTVKIEIIVLNNLLNHAIEEGLINTLPKLSKEGRKRLRTEPKERTVFTADDLEKLCTAAMDTNEDGSPSYRTSLRFLDYIRLLRYLRSTRARSVALALAGTWTLSTRSSPSAPTATKNKTARKVDFNPKLKTHLETMSGRRALDSEWLFPQSATRRQGYSRADLPGVIKAGAGARCEEGLAPCRQGVSRHAALLRFLLRHERD